MGELTREYRAAITNRQHRNRMALLTVMVEQGSAHCISSEPIGSLVKDGLAKHIGFGRYVATPAGRAALAQEQSHER